MGMSAVAWSGLLEGLNQVRAANLQASQLSIQKQVADAQLAFDRQRESRQARQGDEQLELEREQIQSQARTARLQSYVKGLEELGKIQQDESVRAALSGGYGSPGPAGDTARSFVQEIQGLQTALLEGIKQDSMAMGAQSSLRRMPMTAQMDQMGESGGASTSAAPSGGEQQPVQVSQQPQQAMQQAPMEQAQPQVQQQQGMQAVPGQTFVAPSKKSAEADRDTRLEENKKRIDIGLQTSRDQTVSPAELAEEDTAVLKAQADAQAARVSNQASARQLAEIRRSAVNEQLERFAVKRDAFSNESFWGTDFRPQIVLDEGGKTMIQDPKTGEMTEVPVMRFRLESEPENIQEAMQLAEAFNEMIDEGQFDAGTATIMHEAVIPSLDRVIKSAPLMKTESGKVAISPFELPADAVGIQRVGDAMAVLKMATMKELGAQTQPGQLPPQSGQDIEMSMTLTPNDHLQSFTQSLSTMDPSSIPSNAESMEEFAIRHIDAGGTFSPQTLTNFESALRADPSKFIPYKKEMTRLIKELYTPEKASELLSSLSRGAAASAMQKFEEERRSELRGKGVRSVLGALVPDVVERGAEAAAGAAVKSLGALGAARSRFRGRFEP